MMKTVCKNPYKLLIGTENNLNRPITKFYNGNEANVIAAEIRLMKTRPTSFYKNYNHL